MDCQCLDKKKYRVLGKIEEGQFGVVYKAIHLLTSTMVAIKVVPQCKDSSLISKCTARFLKTEISSMKELSHEHLCTLYGTIECQHHIYLVMEYCPGGTLYNLIKSHKGGLPENKARKLLHQIICGVAYMHKRGYVHRDLKGTNIVLTDRQDAKIIDFGFTVKVSSIQSSESKHNRLGTPQFQAPEIFKGRVLNAQKVDIWAIGVIFYVMLSDRLPFPYTLPLNSESMAKLGRNVMTGQYNNLDNISHQASDLLKSLLKVDPESRPTAQELLNHPYFHAEGSQANAHITPLNRAPQMGKDGEETLKSSTLDKECLKTMTEIFQRSEFAILRLVKAWRYDDFTATYLILLEKKRRERKLLVVENSSANPIVID